VIEVVITDMAFASWLVHKGLEIKKVQRTGKRVSWRFEVSQGEFENLESAWPSSPECGFFNTYQVLKGHLK